MYARALKAQTSFSRIFAASNYYLLIMPYIFLYQNKNEGKQKNQQGFSMMNLWCSEKKPDIIDR